jgi:hypothetical protein
LIASNLIPGAGGRFLPRLISLKGTANQVRVESRVGSAKPFHSLRQFKQPARGGLLKESDRANNGLPATNGGGSSGSVVYQEGGGFDFLCQTDGFQFSGVYSQNQIN